MSLDFCSAFSDVVETAGEEAAELVCYGAFMRFLFSGKD
jgi:hypothetical protein